ncbi:gon-4 like protein muscle wasted isoform X1 [Megachile rotundata]|uniref:gon-4 like protein muscle wasted isoform X1 n=2 Tax=Megachile rotundata TaxID=143995 RepID=UPI000614AD85|nr:PREDICTED: GON-4-like protein isoform X2 [Megachile rotundata]
MEESSKQNIAEEEVNNLFPPSVSLNESTKKCNLSFSFNFDFDDVNNDESSDSETADLQIDVSEIDNNEPPNKHKRDTVEETSSVINEMEEEIERQLDAKAAKINLTATNVKNILKHVITNEHVMAMVKNRLYDTEDDVTFEPKLTRAKAKELAAAQVNIPWPITPVKKASSEVQVLIEEELPEDSSDEEYNPEQDKQSDDEKEAENSTSSDVESQPSTPLNQCDTLVLEQCKLSHVQYDPEGIFKIPNIPHVPTEEESIGQRTRSKLCLSETPLEQIEQAFIPPDITTDMYDWDCELDEDWDNFLKEFTQPLTQEPVTEDDPEADPEYNILEDEETDFFDKEELRADKAVKVTRKELNNLIAELFEFTDTFSKQEQEISKKRRSPENINSSAENNMNCSVTDLLPVYKESEFPDLIDSKQRELLATQFRQHVQLTVQHFTMTYMHPDLHSLSITCKQNLNSIKYLSNGPHSAFNVANLPDALKLISDWENKFLDNKFCEDFKKSFADEDAIKKIYLTNKWKYIPKFHPELKKLFMESKALMYPQLLPEIPFRSELNKFARSPYVRSEENLIVLGLEQFLPFVASKPRRFKSKKIQLMDAVQLIIQYLIPCREPHGIFSHIQKRRYAKEGNPIKHFFEKGCAPRTIHYITLECDLKAPKDQPINLLPLIWQTYLNNSEQKIDLLKRKHILNSYNDLMKKNCLTSGNTTVSNIPCLRKLNVNTLPRILPANTNKKTVTKNISKSDSNINENTNCNNLVKVSRNETNTLPHSSDTVCNEERILHDSNFSKTITTQEEEAKKGDKNFEDVQHGVLINSKSSKFSKKSEMVQELPPLRRTTPRLAKTRSAQNMKLMAQVLGSKGLSSNYNTLKTREKIDLDKNIDKMLSLPKIDSEEEIAELMLASTTIKKDSVSRKKAKEARELENIKRLLESENPLNEEERASKFAASYLQKLHLTLESSNPETFRSVIKLYLDYYEKLESINQMESELPFSSTSEFLQNEHIKEKNTKDKDAITIKLYWDVCEKLHEYPELCTDFLLFLKPHQAAMIDKSVEYIMLQKMSDFINVAQIYFAKQPSRIAKIMQAITQLSSDPQTTLEHVHASIGPILKGHPLVMDLFLQILPTAKPPESLFASHMFENLTCPMGPYDKNKIYTEDAPELYENVELPVLVSQEDPYGGENCKCNCHSSDDGTFKNIPEHCVSCGTRFLNGKIYLQTSEGLRPAKIIFPGADEEKLENIARVSLKTVDKFVPSISSRQRKKSSKNEFNSDEQYQKSCVSKNSSTKENEEGGKAVIKSKKNIKSPSKSGDQKRCLKRSGSEVDHVHTNAKRMRITQCKNKKEKKIEKYEVKEKDTNSYDLEYVKLDEPLYTDSKDSTKETTSENTININADVLNDNVNKTSVFNEMDNTVSFNININTKPWTRQEDMILLQTIKKEYSENSLAMVSKTLGNRTIDQVRERCETLLLLLEKMM